MGVDCHIRQNLCGVVDPNSVQDQFDARSDGTH
jgi:hypothetical protein